MHTSVLVKLDFYRCISLDEKISLSFLLTSIGVKNLIGTNFGGNMPECFLVTARSLSKSQMLFELTDCPLDTETIDLFSGDCPIDDSKKHVALIYEPLLSRMTRVQKFFEEIMANENVSGASIDIDAENTFDYQEFDKLDIKVSDFANTMVELFKKHDQWTPTVRINFIK